MSTQTLEKIISVFEDISIVDKNDSSPNGSTGSSPEIVIPSGESEQEYSELDRLTFELLLLVEEYQKLTNGSMKMNFVNGHLNLSRANYNAGTLSKKYGSESLDLRPRNAVKRIRNGQEYEIIDMGTIEKGGSGKGPQEFIPQKPTASGVSRLKSGKLRRRKERENEQQKENENSKEEGNTSGKVETETETVEDLRSKAEDKTDLNQTKEVIDVKFKNPIYQFGGMVPYQLRQAQSYFTKGLEDSIKSLNLQKKIKEVIQKIEAIEKE